MIWEKPELVNLNPSEGAKADGACTQGSGVKKKCVSGNTDTGDVCKQTGAGAYVQCATNGSTAASCEKNGNTADPGCVGMGDKVVKK